MTENFSIDEVKHVVGDEEEKKRFPKELPMSTANTHNAYLNRISCPPLMNDASLMEYYIRAQAQGKPTEPRVTNTLVDPNQVTKKITNPRYSQNMSPIMRPYDSSIKSLRDSASIAESNFANCPDLMGAIISLIPETESVRGLSSIKKDETSQVNQNSAGTIESIWSDTLIPTTETPLSDEKSTETSKTSISILFLNGFLFFMNYMIVFPTAQRFVQYLHGTATIAGVTLGVTCLIGVLTQYPGHKWASRSFKEPLVFSAAVMILGNLMYALAETLNYLALVVIARGIMGINLIMNVVTTRYIAETTTKEERTKLLAIYYVITNSGIAVGPFLAGILGKIPSFTVGPFIADQYVNPAWFCFILWIGQLILASCWFRNPRSILLKPSISQILRKKWRSKSLSCVTIPTCLEKQDRIEQPNVLVSNQSDVPSQKADVVSPREHSPTDSPLILNNWQFSAIVSTIFSLLMGSTVVAALEASVSAIGIYHFKLQEDIVGFLLGGIAAFAAIANFALTALMQWKKLSDRRLLVACHALNFAGLLILFSYSPYNYPLAQFIVGSCLLFAGIQYLRCIQYAILTKLTPLRFTYKSKNGSLSSMLLVAAVVNILGRGIGPLIGAQVERWNVNYLFAIVFAIMAILLIGNLAHWKLLRNPTIDAAS